MPISAPPKTSYPPTKDGALWAAARAGTSDDPRKPAQDRDRELRGRGAAIRLTVDQMRLLRGGKD